jgi:hypothetical protein
VTPADWENLADLAIAFGCGLLLSYAAVAFAAHAARLYRPRGDRCAVRECGKAVGTDGMVALPDGEGGTQLVCRDHVTTDLDRHADLAIAIASGHRTTSEEY